MLFDFLASNIPITIFVALGVVLLWRQNRSAFSWMLNDSERWGRILSRATFGAVSAFLVWVTFFDNWRQLLGYFVEKKERWRSDLYLYDPPPDAVRAITWILFGVAVLGTACLFARYASGYFMPLLLSAGCVVVFFVLNNLRMTFEPAGPLSERGVDFTDPLEAAMTFVWFTMFYVVMAILIYSVFIVFWGPAAFVAALVYRSTFGKRRIVEPEMFRIIRERSAASAASDGAMRSPKERPDLS